MYILLWWCNQSNLPPLSSTARSLACPITIKRPLDCITSCKSVPMVTHIWGSASIQVGVPIKGPFAPKYIHFIFQQHQNDSVLRHPHYLIRQGIQIPVSQPTLQRPPRRQFPLWHRGAGGSGWVTACDAVATRTQDVGEKVCVLGGVGIQHFEQA